MLGKTTQDQEATRSVVRALSRAWSPLLTAPLVPLPVLPLSLNPPCFELGLCGRRRPANPTAGTGPQTRPPPSCRTWTVPPSSVAGRGPLRPLRSPPTASGSIAVSYISLRVTPLHLVVMAPLVHQHEEVELEEEKDLLCKCKRPKFSASVVQSQQEIEVPAIEKENKGHGVLSLEVSVDKEPMDGVTDYVVQSTGEGNSFSKGVHGSASNEPAARSILNTICSAIGWKDPSYEFEEQGPPHNKLFTCKVTVHVDTITSTVVESLSEPNCQKKAALEHAAQGALWCLKRFGHVN